MLTAPLAAAFARVALANVVREYPRHVAHLVTRPNEDLSPRKLHPAFYGSYDWHSAVHMHWLLARVLRLFPGNNEISLMLDRHLSPAALAVELAYFQSAAGKTFERPYGWAWLLELQAELFRLGNATWSKAVQPLAAELARRMAAFVSGAPYPIRAGSHGNTAFACLLTLDYARVVNDAELSSTIRKSARRWYAADRDAPLAYEPSLDDFLSPSLVEAALMQQVMAEEEFPGWSERFFSTDPAQLELPTVADRGDPKQSHLDGLCLSRAWFLGKLGYADAARRHLEAGLRHATGGDYVAEHWLASFAALALGDSP
ncbi:MAG TPA: DUF2891 domain-containing protein [Burkholderiales bacterium]|nr:DUF2891 domain-containing protein [Burkholderiales bacterium]